MNPEPCSTCYGMPHPSGKVCICRGKGTMIAEVNGLRAELLEFQIAVGDWPAMPPQSSRRWNDVQRATLDGKGVRAAVRTIVEALEATQEYYHRDEISAAIEAVTQLAFFGDNPDPRYGQMRSVFWGAITAAREKRDQAATEEMCICFGFGIKDPECPEHGKQDLRHPHVSNSRDYEHKVAENLCISCRTDAATTIHRCQGSPCLCPKVTCKAARTWIR